MTNNDLNQIKEVLKEEIDKALDKRLSATEKNLRFEIANTEKRLRSDVAVVGKQLTSDFDEKLTSTEKRLKSEITTLDEKLTGTEKRLETNIDRKGDEVIDTLLEFIQTHLIPVIAEGTDKSDIDRVERRIDNLADKIGEHDVRLKNIGSIPVIAHQLKIKKAKS